MYYDGYYEDQDGESKRLWGKQWRYIIKGKNVRPIEPFNMEDVAKSYRFYGGYYLYVAPEDEAAVLRWISIESKQSQQASQFIYPDELRPAFKAWLQECYPNDRNVSATVSMAFFAERHGDELGLDFTQILVQGTVPENYKELVEANFVQRGRKDPAGHASIYVRSLRLLFKFMRETQQATQFIYPDELPDDSKEYREGKKKVVAVNIYERNPVARQACINHHGTKCCICGFDFGKTYGDVCEGMIHVHHRKMVSEAEGEYEVNPIEDLIPVCPNCHMVLHSRKVDHCSIDDVRAMISKQAQG